MSAPRRTLPLHEHRVLYLADTNVKPPDLYRMLAAELGLRPGPRAQIVGDIKRALVTLVDERGVVPILVLDDDKKGRSRGERWRSCSGKSQGLSLTCITSA